MTMEKKEEKRDGENGELAFIPHMGNVDVNPNVNPNMKLYPDPASRRFSEGTCRSSLVSVTIKAGDIM